MIRPRAKRPFLVVDNVAGNAPKNAGMTPDSGSVFDPVLDYFRARRAEIDELIDFLSAQPNTETNPEHARSSNPRRGA